MNLARNLIQGAAGGLLSGAVLGLAETTWLLATQGAPDLLAPLYATVLYGLAGLPLGLVGGFVLGLVERRKKLGTRGESFAFVAGSVGAVAPIGVFVLQYMVNKVAFAEQGLPAWAKVAVVAAVVLYGVLAFTVGVRLLQGPLAGLRKGVGVVGAYGALVAVTGVAAVIPWHDDPRAQFAHGKPVPTGMADVPDVLVITVDTLRADHLGAYSGDLGGATPTFDAIASDGIVFEKAFSQASWTRSSFASLWTSRLPSSHNADTKAAMLPAEAELLSEVLQANGVTTGQLANNINVSSTFGFDQGYDTFVYESPDYPFGATESVFGLTLYKVVHKLGERLLGGARHVEAFYQPADVVLGDAKAFLEANAGGRVFLGVHLMEPHDPYFAHPYLDGSGDQLYNGEAYGRAEHEKPDPADADELQRLYLDEVKHLDRELKPFVDWLRSSGRYDRTMIVITADHGEEFGEHGGFWHGTSLFDEQIHVPLIVKLPKSDLAGTRVPWQVRSLDVAPTITTALGIERSPQWEGADLLVDVRAQVDEEKAKADALARQEADARRVLEQLQGQVGPDGLDPRGTDGRPVDPDMQTAVREQLVIVEDLDREPGPCDRYDEARERTVVSEQDFEGNVLSAVRSRGFKYITANAGNPRGLPTASLFDVVEDPGETKDLLGSDDQRCGVRFGELPGVMSGRLVELVEASKAGQVEGVDVQTTDADTCRLCVLGYKSGPECDKCQ